MNVTFRGRVKVIIFRRHTPSGLTWVMTLGAGYFTLRVMSRLSIVRLTL